MSSSRQFQLMIFLRSLRDSKSPQVSCSSWSILVDFNNAVVYIVFILPQISKFSGLFSRPLRTVSSAQITIGIHIYPTPPLGQDMTQGKFLSGV